MLCKLTLDRNVSIPLTALSTERARVLPSNVKAAEEQLLFVHHEELAVVPRKKRVG
jgi:hypothetical protein